MVPLYMKTPDFTEPADPVYYLLAANGVFLVKKTGLFQSITDAGDIAGLERQKRRLSLRFPKIPRAIVERIYGFFDFAYRKWDGEAVAIVFYHPSTRQFEIGIPPQRLYRRRTQHGWRTEGRVEYDFLPRPPGSLKLCDFHSHAGIAAFFSRTDDRDDSEDGLRVVMGRLGRSVPHVCASFVAGGTRFELKPEDVLERFSAPAAPPAEWLGQIACIHETGRRQGAGSPAGGHA